MLERQEAARQEQVCLAAERQDALRAQAAQRERAEAARVAAEQAEAVRLEAAQQEEPRQQAARQEAARVEATRQESARQKAARLGAAQRDAAARLANSLPYSLSTDRRARPLGRSDPNAELVLYAEGWARRIPLNTAPEAAREAAGMARTPAVVTVALQHDGCVESVVFVFSSGSTEVDTVIRYVVQNNAPYPAIPPPLAREYVVVEIRRTWAFDSAVHLY